MARFCPKCDTAPNRPFEEPNDRPGGRNLVVCIDGTANQFGVKNTNVIELYSHLVNDKDQLIYYNSGIGTYSGHDGRVVQILKAIPRKVEMMVAKNISKIVQRAYRWLAENYQDDDRIYLFGFSRGAYAVRILAAMIRKVGLINKGNEEQIPFAYAIYEDPDTEKVVKNVTNKVSRSILINNNKKKIPLSSAQVFKETFSRDVSVHFVGLWDTVSSIGIVRRDSYPGSDNPHTACYFRHALALDERRVKFLPEYACGGQGATGSAGTQPDDCVKEVWFSGSHSDIGGGNVPNLSLDNGPAPLIWMMTEAYAAGLNFDPAKLGAWNTVGPVHESLRSLWTLLEYLPVKRLSYTGENSLTRRWHRGRGRPVQPGQRIHISVALFRPDQSPRATLPESSRLRWTELVDTSRPLQGEWADIIEIDAFAAKALVSEITQPGEDPDRCLHLLVAITNLRTGLDLLRDDPPSVLSLFNAMKQKHKHAAIIKQTLDRIGYILNGAVFDTYDGLRPHMKADMETMIDRLKMHRPGLEVVVVFLHKYNLMRAPFAKQICDDILSWDSFGDSTFDREVLCGALKALTVAAKTDEGITWRNLMAKKIGGSLLHLLKDSHNWGGNFEAVHELLEELTKHATSRHIAFGDVPALLHRFKELASSSDESEAIVCEHSIRIFGALCASKQGRRSLEGRLLYPISSWVGDTLVEFGHGGLLMDLLEVLVRGGIQAALRCFWFFEKLLSFEDTQANFKDDEFLAALKFAVCQRTEVVIKERFFIFVEKTLKSYLSVQQSEEEMRPTAVPVNDKVLIRTLSGRVTVAGYQ